jgi:divalent metal cation (Fe/Co/Zn/Cd) transporter
MNQHVVQLAGGSRAKLIKRGKLLEYFTISYNSLEGLIAFIVGILAGSIALVSFGFDSVIEVSSGVALLWRLHADKDMTRRDNAERISLRIIGVAFLALALYVAYDSVGSLIGQEAPDESLPGIILAIASLIIMPALARAKRSVARGIGSGALAADAKQTELCTYLSAILLGGLLLNALLGWWWADPVAAVVMVPIIAKEGIEALQGKTCCDEGCH